MATAITTADRMISTLMILVAMAAGVAIDSLAQPYVQEGRTSSNAFLNFVRRKP